MHRTNAHVLAERIRRAYGWCIERRAGNTVINLRATPTETGTMTTTPTAKLTGTELLEAIRANPEFDDAQIVAHCGYTDDAEFYEVLLEARGVELEHERLMMELGITTEEFKANHNKEAVGEHFSCIAALGFRYLTYQYMLD